MINHRSRLKVKFITIQKLLHGVQNELHRIFKFQGQFDLEVQDADDDEANDRTKTICLPPFGGGRNN